MARTPERPTPERGLPECFGPYLRYAIATDFRTFESLDEAELRLFLLVEFKRGKAASDFEKAMTSVDVEIEVGPYSDDSRFATLRSRKAAVTERRTFPIWDDYVSGVELSLPVKPSGVPRLGPRILRDRWREGKDSPGPLLIGMLDDGCPFAAAHFAKSTGARSTRVRGIWDQNGNKQPIPVIDSNGKQRLFGELLATDFDYGIEFRRDFAASLGTVQMGLDEWISLHSTPTGIDEDGCYADAGCKRLAGRQSHGAHVMDVLAGRTPISSRVGPSPPGDRRDPPSWNVDTGPASSADVVFVQFSEDCIRDATGVWLKAYVLDGIEYIMSFADPKITKNVIINLSYGPTTGPHDGTSELLEAALTDLVGRYDGSPGKPKLEIFLAAGNAYLGEGHVAFTNDTKQPVDVTWTWRLPPDNKVLCFAEVWTDNATAGGITVTLTSPGGTVFSSATGPVPPSPDVTPPPFTGVYTPVVRGSHTMWLLSVEPTIAGAGVVAEHGEWTVDVTGVGVNAEVHAYVARSDPNMGVRTGAKRSYFVDPAWERARAAAADCAYANGEFDKTGSLVHRFGTLNGIATGKHVSLHVAGGYILANGRKSPYSSAGPARRSPLALRHGPDFALLGDESDALRGVRAGGNRSGGVFRLIGTSAAAPQLARWAATSAIPPASKVPSTPSETFKRGGGNLKPP